MTIRIDHHVYVHKDHDNSNKLDELLHLVKKLQREEEKIMATQQELTDQLTALASDVGDLTNVVQSGEHLLDELTQLLTDALANPVAATAITQAQAIVSQIDAMKSELAASIAKNTPAAPPTTP